MTEAHVPFEHRGTRAIQRMVEFAPSTGGLALWVGHRDIRNENLAAGPDVRAVTTDGQTVFYGSTFEKLPLAEQTGLVAHEVLHIALRHPQRYLDLRRLLGDVDLRLFNVCADAIVNSALSHLSWLRLPARAVYLDRLLSHALGLQQDIEAALIEWDVERLYRAIDDRKMPDHDGRRQGGSNGASGANAHEQSSDGHNQQATPDNASPAIARADGPNAARTRELSIDSQIDLVPSADSQTAPEAEAEFALEWSERILRGHAGDGAFSMLRTLIADLPRSRTPWQQVLRTRLARGLSRKTSVSWSRPTRSYIANQGRGGPNRRLPFEPGFSAARTAPRLAVIVDVSGSIDDDLMTRFADEIAAISRRQEADLVLVIGDDKVRRVKVFKPGRFDRGEITFEGGGGTDFTPLLREADRYRPDIAVVLTDLEGPAHFQPSWQVIWAVPPSHAAAVPPFGRLMSLS